MHHCGVTSLLDVDLAEAYPTSPVASGWLDDLVWHRKSWRESIFRWYTEDALKLVTWATGGRMEFTRVDDLVELRHAQERLIDDAARARHAMADRLTVVKAETGLQWSRARELMGLTRVEAESAIWFAEHAPAEDRVETADVRRVLGYIPFRNPLSEAWELKQLVGLLEAAGDMLEDTICDLVEELLPTRPAAVLGEAAGTPNERGLLRRVEVAREERGHEGDPRRLPEQIFA